MAAKDYFALVHEELPKEVIANLSTLPYKDLKTYIPDLFCSSVDPRSRGSSRKELSFDLRFYKLIQQLDDFWTDHAPGISLEAEDPSYTITLDDIPIARELDKHVRRLAIYFDSIQLVDPLHLHGKKRDDYLADPGSLADRFAVLERFACLLRLEPLVNAASDWPILRIVPDPIEVGNHAFLHAATSFMSEMIFGDADLSLAEFYRRVESTSAGELESRRQQCNVWEDLLDLFSEKDQGSAGAWMVNFPGYRYSGVRNTTLRQVPFPSQIMTVWSYVADALWNINSVEAMALVTHSDPVLYGPSHFIASWHKRRLGQMDTARTEGPVAANAIMGDDLAFLEAVNVEQLKRLREEGMLEELRTELRLERGKFLVAAKRGVRDATKAFASNALRIIEEHGKAYEADMKRDNRRMLAAGLVFGCTAGLKAAAIAWPAIHLINLLSDSMGLVVGGVSLKGFVDTLTRKKQTAKRYSETPLTLLYHAKESYDPNR